MASLVTWEAMPQVPPSPTLTNPDMILPDLSDSQDSTPSPRLLSERPPSPSLLLRQSLQLSKPPPGRSSRPSTSARASVVDSANADGETTPKGHNQRGHVPASSPTSNGTPRTNVMQNWQRDMARLGNEAAPSSDAQSGHWSGFDGIHGDSDGSAEDGEGRYGSLPYVAGSDEDTDNEQWLEGEQELDLEAISSAALSKRAEMILANAKKRLNLMEGNLRGARQSLLPNPRAPYNPYNLGKRASSISPTPKSGPIYIPQAKHAPSPLSSNGSPGHARIYSEISMSSPPHAGFSQHNKPAEKRAVSAMGSFGDQWSPHDPHTYNRSSGLRGVRSQEAMRNTWVTPEQHGLRAVSRGSSYLASPGLETLPEDEDPTKPGSDVRRSASTTGDLRAQMQDLKGRISSLKERAREDGMKRRSLQNLRTPSPFTASQIWEPEADSYKHSSPSGYDPPRGSQNQINGASAGTSPRAHTAMELGRDSPGNHSHYQESHYDDAEEQVDGDRTGYGGTQVLEELEETVRDDIEPERQEREADGESIYEDASQVVAERHEDRADAFDYEHFFLHSALGAYSREQRSASVSSEGSVETTRPASPSPAQATETSLLDSAALSPHRRTQSQESISTIATFQTATEGRSSGSDDEEEEENEALDQFAEQALGHRHIAPKLSNTSLRSSSSGRRQLRSAGSSHSLQTSSSGQRQPRSPGSIYSQNVHSPRDSTPESMNDPTAKIMASFFSSAKEREQLTPLRQKDEDLLYALTSSLQQVCARLQNAEEGDYEARIWRRRLDEARKILDGVPNEEI